MTNIRIVLYLGKIIHDGMDNKGQSIDHKIGSENSALEASKRNENQLKPAYNRFDKHLHVKPNWAHPTLKLKDITNLYSRNLVNSLPCIVKFTQLMGAVVSTLLMHFSWHQGRIYGHGRWGTCPILC
ncbi:hypothetical protein YC2023_016080 [Brassica napus]